MVRSYMYSSCLARHNPDTASALSPSLPRYLSTAECTSSRVPYASNTHALIPMNFVIVVAPSLELRLSQKGMAGVRGTRTVRTTPARCPPTVPGLTVFVTGEPGAFHCRRRSGTCGCQSASRPSGVRLDQSEQVGGQRVQVIATGPEPLKRPIHRSEQDHDEGFRLDIRTDIALVRIGAQQILQHFDVSPINALRLRKTAEDNGTQIPLSFIARLTGNDEAELRDLAVKRGYTIDE